MTKADAAALARYDISSIKETFARKTREAAKFKTPTPQPNRKKKEAPPKDSAIFDPKEHDNWLF